MLLLCVNLDNSDDSEESQCSEESQTLHPGVSIKSHARDDEGAEDNDEVCSVVDVKEECGWCQCKNTKNDFKDKVERKNKVQDLESFMLTMTKSQINGDNDKINEDE